MDTEQHTLPDDHPLCSVNEQIKWLMEGEGDDEDAEDVLHFLRYTGLPEGTVRRMHACLVLRGSLQEAVKIAN